MMRCKETKMTGQPLLLMKSGELVCYRAGSLVIYDTSLEIEVKRIRLPGPAWKRWLSRIRLFDRLLHNDARWAIQLDNLTFLVEYAEAVWRVSLNNGEITKEYSGFSGKPIAASVIDDVANFSKSIVFGDYGTNAERRAVRIHRRKLGSPEWDIAFEYSAQTVRHVHNIIPAKGCVYILTGDENSECGIWKATDDFDNVVPFWVGKQEYRCCQMLPTGENDGFFVTDIPSEKNYLLEYTDKCVNRRASLPGSCIYGVRMNGGLLFSTTVEPDARAKNRVDYWLSNKPGQGIDGNEVYVYYLRDTKLQKLGTFAHDGLSLRLFQYATVRFCNAIDNVVFFSATSVVKNDHRIFKAIAD